MLVTPDGEFLREHTLASSSGERVRYAFPTPWFPIVAGILALLAIVLFLLMT